MTWLKFNRCEDDANRVTSLYCSVCQEFDYRLRGLTNYSAAFVTGANNLRCSNFKDHSKTDMHTKAMSLYREKTARSSVMESAPIIRALNTMDKSLEKMIKKFQVAYTTVQLTGNVARRYSRVPQWNPPRDLNADIPCTRPASNCVDKPRTEYF